MRVWSLSRKDHSSILAWEIPWTEEPDGLQSMEPQRVHEAAKSWTRLKWQRTHTKEVKPIGTFIFASRLLILLSFRVFSLLESEKCLIHNCILTMSSRIEYIEGATWTNNTKMNCVQWLSKEEFGKPWGICVYLTLDLWHRKYTGGLLKKKN